MIKLFTICLLFVSGAYFISENTSLINREGTTIENRIIPPVEYERTTEKVNSFGEYLRQLELKPHGSQVMYYYNQAKTKEGVYMAVVKMDIGKKDLQQCADAVMRLKGEYLYKHKKYDQIHFNFLSDNKPRYFKEYAEGDYSYEKFRKYMEYIFAYANTGSLHDELLPVTDYKSMNVGDVFIQKGTPFGHAVIVVDMAVNPKNGKKLFLLAQSYMPAQETQILINPNNSEISPWYELKEGEVLTPEWTFNSKDLRRFRD